MADRDELVSQFIEICGTDDNVARFYLGSSNWSLEEALSNFLGNQTEDEGNDELPNLMNEESNSSLDQAETSELPKNFVKSGTSAKPKFGTMKDMVKKIDTDEEEGQAFYAGGSDRSGQQVLGPPKQKNLREKLSDMFRSSSTSQSIGNPSTSNWGQGIRLGMTENDHTVVASSKKETKKPVVILKLWSQGFSIDDGELRLYDDPQNKEFLEIVMRGEIPKELLDMGKVVNVDVEDHRQEDYKKQKSVPKNFKGYGHALGSCEINAASQNADVPTEAQNNEEAAKEEIQLDPSQPTTVIQVRLADGSRLTAQFNLSHNVADIENYIQRARPQYAGRDFVLVSSFPRRELNDKTISIEAADLKNAALIQRLK